MTDSTHGVRIPSTPADDSENAMTSLFDQITEAADALRQRWDGHPRFGIVLGTGLGALVNEMTETVEIPYADLPHFLHSSVESHAGKLICGQLGGQPVLAMQGRFHAYEGYSLQEITFPVRVMKAMGCEYLVVSNACGGMNPQYQTGDLMLIEDHINLLGDNPLIGPNDDRLGVRFPDMSEPYSRELLTLARQITLEERIVCHQGVYVAVPGPNLETRAEYRFLRTIGADVVGMSTVPEVIVGVHASMKILGISVITDMCFPDALQPVSLQKIIQVANQAEPKLATLVRRVIASIPT